MDGPEITWSICQGLVAFLWPGLASHLRQLYLPLHTALGTAIFALASINALLGITEKAIWSLGKKWQVVAQYREKKI